MDNIQQPSEKANFETTHKFLSAIKSRLNFLILKTHSERIEYLAEKPERMECFLEEFDMVITGLLHTLYHKEFRRGNK